MGYAPSRTERPKVNTLNDLPSEAVLSKITNNTLGSRIGGANNRSKYGFYLTKTLFNSVDVTFRGSPLITGPCANIIR